MGTLDKVSLGDGRPKYAVVNGTTGDVEAVAAVAGKKIRVLSYHFHTGATTVALRFESGAGGTALSGVMIAGGASTFAAEFNPCGHFETAAGAALSLEVGGGDIDGHLTYIEVD